MAEEERRMLLAFGVTTVFMMVEVVGGLVSNSLALLADAGHMLVDSLSLLMAWGGFRLGRLAPDPKRSYGYRRLEVLAALANGVTVVGLSVWIIYEAALRLGAPHEVMGLPMLGVAVIGLLANLATLRILDHGGHGHAHGHGHEHEGSHGHAHREERPKRRVASLNLQGATLHVLGDLLGSVAAIAAAGVILTTGWTPIDPILSVAIAVMIVLSGIKVIRSATHILLEGSPEDFDPDRLRDALLAQVVELREIHHLHAWSVTSGQHMLTLHAVVDRAADRDKTLARVKRVLAADFGFDHSVVQLEGEGCEDEGRGCG